jgi:hypothetical protein
MIVVQINLGHNEKPTMVELAKLGQEKNLYILARDTIPPNKSIVALAADHPIIFIPFKGDQPFFMLEDSDNAPAATGSKMIMNITPPKIQELLTNVFVQPVNGIQGALKFLELPREAQKEEKASKPSIHRKDTSTNPFDVDVETEEVNEAKHASRSNPFASDDYVAAPSEEPSAVASFSIENSSTSIAKKNLFTPTRKHIGEESLLGENTENATDSNCCSYFTSKCTIL